MLLKPPLRGADDEALIRLVLFGKTEEARDGGEVRLQAIARVGIRPEDRLVFGAMAVGILDGEQCLPNPRKATERHLTSDPDRLMERLEDLLPPGEEVRVVGRDVPRRPGR